DEVIKELAARGIQLQFSTDRDELRDATAYYFTAPEVRITHVEDYSTGLSYLEVHPREGGLTEELVERLGVLPVLSVAELRNAAASEYRGSPELLTALGPGEGAQEAPATLDLLRAALADAEPGVRDYAVQAMAQTGWRDFLPDLDTVV